MNTQNKNKEVSTPIAKSCGDKVFQLKNQNVSTLSDKSDGSIIVLTDNRVILNDLLCYVQNKIDILPQDTLNGAVSGFYSEIEIKSAKDLLYDKYAESVTPPMENVRRSGSGKSLHNIADIYHLMSRIPTKLFPLFATANLTHLPPLDPDVFDIFTTGL